MFVVLPDHTCLLFVCALAAFRGKEYSGISWFISFLQGNQYLCIDADETGSLVALGTKDGQ